MLKIKEFFKINKKYISHLLIMTVVYGLYLTSLNVLDSHSSFFNIFNERILGFLGALGIFFFVRILGLIFILFFKIKKRFFLIVDSIIFLYLAIALYIGLYLRTCTITPTHNGFGDCIAVGIITLLGALFPAIPPFGIGYPFVILNYKLLKRVLRD